MPEQESSGLSRIPKLRNVSIVNMLELPRGMCRSRNQEDCNSTRDSRCKQPISEAVPPGEAMLFPPIQRIISLENRSEQGA